MLPEHHSSCRLASDFDLASSCLTNSMQCHRPAVAVSEASVMDRLLRRSSPCACGLCGSDCSTAHGGSFQGVASLRQRLGLKSASAGTACAAGRIFVKCNPSAHARHPVGEPLWCLQWGETAPVVRDKVWGKAQMTLALWARWARICCSESAPDTLVISGGGRRQAGR